MPVKILLADKSITIQKVVEMLFSGKEYEVLCVSDGETALSEAERVVPDVVLADIDLPRLDGYTFAVRLKQKAALARTPVILMMSRDDVFDEAKARQASIVDHIAKPFESQELIGKVKKAVSAAPQRPAEQAPAAARPAPAPPASGVSTKPATAPKQAPPPDIFDIIQEAPTRADLKRTPAPPAREENVYEVEPVIEVEEPLAREVEHALPVGDKAVEEMRAGLGLGRKNKQEQPEIVSFESLDMAMSTANEYRPRQEAPRRPESKPSLPPMREAREYVPPPPETAFPSPAVAVSEEKLRSMVEASVAKIVREIAREVIEKVAWEVIPDLAEMLIKAEIERLKVET